MDSYHKSVLVDEICKYLGLTNAHLNTNAKIIDATLGAGGYTLAFCEKGANVLGIETDPAMLQVARARLEKVLRQSSGSTTCPASTNSSGGAFNLVGGNFANIGRIARDNGFTKVDGIVFDLGVASEQLTSPTRGLSFRNENAPLDMRLDSARQGVKASDLLNALDKTALTKVFLTTCGRSETGKLVERILVRRGAQPFATVGDFLEATRGIFKKGKINPATRPFLALRMAVNSELENLSSALFASVELLDRGGRLIVVSFHSGEDALVKELFLKFQKEGIGKVATKKPIVPSDKEVFKNPRARSAKMRVFRKK